MIKDFLPKNRAAKKLEAAKIEHSKFIDSVIDYLKDDGYSIHDAQTVAQIADVAARGQAFVALLESAQAAVDLILENKLHPIDALLAAQVMALIMKNEKPDRIISGAKQIAVMYAKTGFQQNLFTTDMNLMGQKLTEALGKMNMSEIKVHADL